MMRARPIRILFALALVLALQARAEETDPVPTPESAPVPAQVTSPENFPSATRAVVPITVDKPIVGENPEGGATPAQIQELVEEHQETQTEKDQAAREAAEAEQAKLVDPNIEFEKQKRKSGIAKLVAKLTRKDGTLVPVALLPPLDYTGTNMGELAEEVIYQTIERYGDFNIKSKKYVPPSITLEQFRLVVTRYNVDVVIVAILKPTNFDIFLYDRRTPYRIYSHSEVLPDQLQYQITRDLVQEYMRVVVRRALYAYMQDQFFDLPREMAPKILSVEVPRWIANPQNYNAANREILSNFYASAFVGGALSLVKVDRNWNSSLVGLQAGLRLFDHLYLDLSAESFTYNGFLTSLKYQIPNAQLPFRLSAGIGAAYAMSDHSIHFDLSKMDPLSHWFVVPSFAVTFPLVDMHVKVESHLYLSQVGVFLTVAPGIFVMF